MSTHTPGPWKIHPYINNFGGRNETKDVGPSGRAVCEVFGAFEAPFGAESEANARLIAAAPEMLEALRTLVAAISYNQNPDTLLRESEFAREVIAKAEGKS